MEISLTAQKAAHQPAVTRAVRAVFYTEAMQNIFHLELVSQVNYKIRGFNLKQIQKLIYNS